jgi:hypothetical protein
MLGLKIIISYKKGKVDVETGQSVFVVLYGPEIPAIWSGTKLMSRHTEE